MTEKIEVNPSDCWISEDTYCHGCVLGGFSFLPLDMDCPACGMTLEKVREILAADQEVR